MTLKIKNIDEKKSNSVQYSDICLSGLPTYVYKKLNNLCFTYLGTPDSLLFDEKK